MLLAVAALLLFCEEWGWRPLVAVMAWLAKWPPLARLEAAIRGTPPLLALVLFLLPGVLLFPVKLAALWLMHQGRAELGLFVIIAAKLIGTALLARLFVLTEPQLMHFTWFARALVWWRATKLRVKLAIRRSLTWRTARIAKWRARNFFRRFGQ